MNNSSAPDSDHSNPLNPATATPLVQIFVPTLPKAAIIGKASATPQADPTVQQRSFPDGYLTDYSVFLVGNVGTEFVRQFRVSGRTPVWLDNREFVLLYLLAKHAELQVNPDSKRMIMTTERIVKEIGEFLASEAPGFALFQHATNNTVAKVVLRLRKKLEKNLIRRDLIESGPDSFGGYRLSTRPEHVKYSLTPRIVRKNSGNSPGTNGFAHLG